MEVLQRRPGRPRSEAAEAAILDAAIEQLAEKGYSGFSIEAVAARAGVAKTTIYRRWPGKDELVFDAISLVKGPIPELPEGSVRDQLVYLIDHARLSWFDGTHGRMMRRFAADGTDRPDIYVTFRDRVVLPRQALTRSVIERGIAEGVIRAGVEIGAIQDLLIAPIISAVMTHRDPLTRAQVEFIVDTVLRGVSA